MQYGRQKIFTDADRIDESNIEQVLSEAIAVHAMNAQDIQYLMAYAKGAQPILNRTKNSREDINNKVCLNVAAEVIDFKSSYIFSSPIDIVRPADCESDVDIAPFKRLMAEQGKDGVDQKIAQDLLTCGLGYRGTLPNPRRGEASPFAIVHMQPTTTFCIYKNSVFQEKVLDVSFVVKKDGSIVYTAYDESFRYELSSTAAGSGVHLVSKTVNGAGAFPVQEYEMPDRMGCFEKAISVMNAMNTAASNRIDDVEQFVQSILWICGIDLDDDQLAALKDSLCLITPKVQEGVTPEVKFLVNSIDQNGVQQILDDLYSHVLELCGIPGREQASGGNTGSAQEMGGSGWRKVQYSAERIIAKWKEADRGMYKTAIAILQRSAQTSPELRRLQPTDLETNITISKNSNLLSKAQALKNLLDAGISPRIAIREVDLFSDPEAVYEESKDTIKQAFEASTKPKSDGGDDVTNQPQGDESLNSAVNGKGTVQKPD